MRRTKQFIEDVGIGLPIVLTSFPASFAIIVPEGVMAVFGVEHTYDEIGTEDAAWFPSQDVQDGTRESVEGGYSLPVTAIRINVEALSGGKLRVLTLQGVS